jgi:transcriptional regulator with XRE-family HTH domain
MTAIARQLAHTIADIPLPSRSRFHGAMAETFAERLRRLLADKPMTQEDLARRTGASLRTVAGWVAGRQPDLRWAEPISRALEVTLEELVGGLRLPERASPGDAAQGAADAKTTLNRAQEQARSDTPRRRTQGQGPPRSA